MTNRKNSTFDYTTATARLEDILTEIQSRNIGVDEAIALHKEGTQLVKDIELYLTKAEHSIQKLIVT